MKPSKSLPEGSSKSLLTTERSRSNLSIIMFLLIIGRGPRRACSPKFKERKKKENRIEERKRKDERRKIVILLLMLLLTLLNLL